ncbi:unnamed protein product [Echinostoma caproni]|uniref:Mediator of RNA polymerase II transcription subunit 14 n=1 Tax=Echinostoma caproni TaxID=27848 RepID=A0A183AL74_9TREM|nr:unnamed protein product [Echinostoma caproni]
MYTIARLNGPAVKSKESKSSTRTGDSTAQKSVLSFEDEMASISQNLRDETNNNASGSQSTPILAIHPKEFWIDIKEFCDVFNVIDVYHKTQTYPVVKTYTDLKSPGIPMDRTPPNGQYISIDSLYPSEIILSFSAICRWPLPSPKDTKVSISCGLSSLRDADDGENGHLEVEKPLTNGTDSEPPGQTPNEAIRVTMPPPAAATLIVETQHWLKNQLGEPVKRLDVTGTRALSLLLPPGRHSYRLLLHAPLGFVLQMLVTSIEPLEPTTPGAQSITYIPAVVAPGLAWNFQVAEDKTHPISHEKLTQLAPKMTQRPANSARGRPILSGHAKQTGTNWTTLNVQMGDEDTVLADVLSLTPIRMRSHAQRLIRALGQLGIAYSEMTQPEKWSSSPLTIGVSTVSARPRDEVNLESEPAVMDEMELYNRTQRYLEYLSQKQSELAELLGVSEGMSLEEHAKLTDYRQTLLAALQKLCNEDGSANADMNFAWRVTQFDMTTPNPFGVLYKPRAFLYIFN